MAAPSARIRISGSIRISSLTNDSRLFPGSGRSDSPALIEFFFPNTAPRAAVLLEQLITFDGAPRARGIVWRSAGRQCVPHIEDRLNHAPARLDHVRALKQRGVARHAVAQQPFVAGTVFQTKIGGIVEVHV